MMSGRSPSIFMIRKWASLSAAGCTRAEAATGIPPASHHSQKPVSSALEPLGGRLDRRAGVRGAGKNATASRQRAAWSMGPCAGPSRPWPVGPAWSGHVPRGTAGRSVEGDLEPVGEVGGHLASDRIAEPAWKLQVSPG